MATGTSTNTGDELAGPLRYVLLSLVVSVGVVALKFVGYLVGGPAFLFSGWVAVVLLLIVMGALAIGTSKADGGVLLTIFVAYPPVLAVHEFGTVLGIGHPNPGVLVAAALALVVAVPVGLLGYLIGRQL